MRHFSPLGERQLTNHESAFAVRKTWACSGLNPRDNNRLMTKGEAGGHTCYHCKEWIAEGVAHDCWTTTESALTRDLPQDLLEAWARLRETAAEFGEQRVYASHKSIMFARTSCYFFVRPKKSALEVCFFLRRMLRHPRIRRSDQVSSSKVAHTIHLKHRDEVESPITDWLLEAYETSALPAAGRRTPTTAKARKTAAAKKGSNARTTVGRASPKRRG